MRIGLVIIVLLAVSDLVSAQTADSADSVKEPKPINLPLARRNPRPAIGLKKALEIAERYIAREKIETKDFYLYQAKFIMFGEKEKAQPAWHFQWINENGAVGNYIEIIVRAENGAVSRLPSL